MSASKREETLSNMLFSSIENGDNDISKAAISLGVQGHKRYTKFIKETLVKLNKEIFSVLVSTKSWLYVFLIDFSVAIYLSSQSVPNLPSH
mgnify:CR=1 FL=1